MKRYTKDEALFRLTALCAGGEYCTQDMLDKMERWELPEVEQTQIMQHLVENRYIDDERFCRAFIRDKLFHNKWGRRKIEQALYMKRIDKEISDKFFAEIDDEEILRILRPLIDSKRNSIKAKSDYEMNAKLIRFALQRGFEMDLIQECL